MVSEEVDMELLMKALANPEMRALLNSLAKTMKLWYGALCKKEQNAGHTDLTTCAPRFLYCKGSPFGRAGAKRLRGQGR